MWERTAIVKRQAEDSTIDQDDWTSSPTTPQDNELSDSYPCSLRTETPQGSGSEQGYNLSGDAVIVGPNTLDIKEKDEIKFSDNERYKVVTKPIPFHNWLRMEVERLG